MYKRQGYNSTDAFRRYRYSGTWSSWAKEWNSLNDGSGSSLDADLLDGQHASAFATSAQGTLATNALPKTGGTMTGTLNVSATTNARDVKISAGYHLQRSDHHSGHLEGSYNNIGANGSKSNPIYTIGSSYNPQDAALSNMYGIGFSDEGSAPSFFPGSFQGGWGMYVAADGDARVFLDGSSGHGTFTGQVRATGFYDVADTAYYIDPPSTGTALSIQGGVSILSSHSGGNIELNYPYGGNTTYAGNMVLFMSEPGVTHDGGGIGTNVDIRSPYYGRRYNHGYGVYLRFDKTAGSFEFWNTQGNAGSSSGRGTRRVWGDASGNLYSEASMRSSIFYDRDDTAYFTNPNSDNRLSQLRLASHLSVGNLGDASPSTLSTSGVITFGTLSTDAVANYCIKTTLENYGGNYNKLDLAFHTGIRLGAHPNYGGVRFYTDQTMGTEIFAVGKSGNFVQAANSMRAPIFYDSNDTTYYTNPAGTSIMGAIDFNTAVASASAGGLIGRNYAYDTLELRGHGQEMMMGSKGDNLHINYRYCNNDTSGSQTPTNWYWRNGTASSYSNHYWGLGQASLSLRAPIFYDSNDTGYYTNPASNTHLNTLSTAGAITVGTGASSDIYMSDSDEGARRIHCNSNRIGFLNSSHNWGGYCADNGDWTTDFISYAGASSRAPLFYDSNDTAYYLDPHSGSRLSSVNLNVGNENTGAANSSTAGLIMRGNYNSNTWAHKFHKMDHGGGVPLYLSSTSGAGNWTGVQRWGAYTGSTYTSQIFGSLAVDSSVSTPIVYDKDSTGYYTNPASNTHLNTLSTAGAITVGNGASSNIYMSDSDEGVRRIHCNSNRIGFLNSSSNWGSYCGDNGDWHTDFISYSGASSRAPLFYDSQNTGYYFDGASSSTSVRINGDVLCDGQYGKGMVGLYSSTRLQHVFSMGGAYRLAADGTSTGNMYGMAWSHPNAGTVGGANHLNDHGLLIINNGSFRAAISSRAVFSADVRGTLFYDYNNTGYYCDPSSTSNVNTFQVAGVLHANGGITVDGAAIFNGSDTWFRSHGATGWYSASYGGGMYMTDSTYVRVYNGKGLQVDSTNGIRSSGNITAYYSDERLKTKTGKIENALEKVQSLSGFTYVENELARSLGYENENEQVALSAQDVQKVMPQAVSLAPCDMEVGEFDGVVTSKSGENYLTVDYARLIPLLVESIKELTDKVEMLEKQLK